LDERSLARSSLPFGAASWLAIKKFEATLDTLFSAIAEDRS